MNKKQIGRLIEEKRKEKNMTQKDLADVLGVTESSVLNWEKGTSFPDTSTLNSLSELLNINMNELLNNKYDNKKALPGLTLLIFGIILIIISFIISKSENNWIYIYILIGTLITTIGFYNLINNINKIAKIIISIIFLFTIIFLILTLDYINVSIRDEIPKFAYRINTKNHITEYETILYNVYKISDNDDDYIIIDKNKKYSIDTIENSPYIKFKSGIENIIKYKDKYMGDNSNIGNLINTLPLSSFGYDFEINSEELSLTINYHVSLNYQNLQEDNYLEKSIIYNSVSLMLLIDNIETINYNFSGYTYTVTRDEIENKYPNYEEIKTDMKINTENFKKYIEKKINDTNFIENLFNKIFK